MKQGHLKYYTCLRIPYVLGSTLNTICRFVQNQATTVTVFFLQGQVKFDSTAHIVWGGYRVGQMRYGEYFSI